TRGWARTVQERLGDAPRTGSPVWSDPRPRPLPRSVEGPRRWRLLSRVPERRVPMNEVNPAPAIVAKYDGDLDQHGDSFRGVGWTSQEPTDRRYRVMLDLSQRPGRPVPLLDFGCGLSHFYEFMEADGA